MGNGAQLKLGRKWKKIDMKRRLSALLLCSIAASCLTGYDDPSQVNDESSPVFKAAQVGVFPSAGLFDFPVVSGREVRQVAHSAGLVSGDVLSVDCFPSVQATRGPGTILCRTPVRPAPQTVAETAVEPGSSAGGQVRFEDLVTTVLDHAQAPGVELVIQPDQGWVYTDIPTVGYFLVDDSDAEGVFGGVPARLRWFATGFDVVFEPGAPAVHAARAGAPWPDHTVEYTYRGEGYFTPEATVSWGVEVTIGGQSLTYNHARQTHLAYPTPIHAKTGQAHLIPNPWETH